MSPDADDYEPTPEGRQEAEALPVPCPPHLTEEDLERIAWYCQHASQGPTQVIQVPPEWDPADWCRDALLSRLQKEAYGVAVGTAETIMEQGARMTAFTGNGSQSHANANFYMMCHSAVPVLVREVLRCWAALAEGDPAWRIQGGA